MSKNEVETTKSNSLPAHLQGGKTTKVGNVDSTDLIIPRVKLMQLISPEVTDFDNAKAGQFWHTVAGESLTQPLRAIPIIMRKTYVLWSPRNDDRGILARANDGINWDLPEGTEFTVKPKNSPHPITYTLGKTVHEKTGDGPALSEFGSSIPGDPKSPPAAALTYQFLWYFPDHPELSPAIVINTRSSVKPAQQLLSKIDLRPVDHFGQVYKIGVQREGTDLEPFYNYTYISDGYASAEEFDTAKMMYEKFANEEWRANEESTDTDIGEHGGGKDRSSAPVGDDIPF